MAYAQFDVMELRMIDQTTTFNTAFSSAAPEGAWDAGVKLRVHDLETDINYESVKDLSLQDAMHKYPANLPTVRNGSIKFKMYLEGGDAGATLPAIAPLLKACLGGSHTGPAASDAAEAESTSSAINATAHGRTAGEAVLVGVRGDGYAEGNVGFIETATTDAFVLHTALPGAAQTDDVLKYGHTFYLDPDVEHYIDFLLIGNYSGSGATDYPNQFNMIGCSGVISAIGGLNAGEQPFVEFTFSIGDWRPEPYATMAIIDPSTAYGGDNPAGNLYIGSCLIGDASAVTRVEVKGGNFEVALNQGIAPIMDLNGVNGRSGWYKQRAESGVTFKIDKYWGDQPGLYDDFVNGTAKTILLAYGHEATKTFAIFMQRAYADNTSGAVNVAGNVGQQITFHASNASTTDYSDDDDKMADSALLIALL